MDCILITGGAGWVGSHLVGKLHERGHKVIAYDNFKGIRAFDVVRHGAKLVEGNILDSDLLMETVRNHRVNKIIHAAAIVGVPASFKDPGLTVRVNVEGTMNVLEVMKNAGIEIGINLSTEEAYGNYEYEPVDEEHPLKPTSIYGITKVASEAICKYYRDRFNINMISVRTSWLYGPKFHRPRPPQNILEDALNGRETVMVKGGEFKTDYTYIDDLIQGIMLILDKMKTVHSVYNIASGKSYTVWELADLARDLIPTARFKIGPGLLTTADDSQFPQKGALDIKRAMGELGFAPHYDLREGLMDNIKRW